MKLTVKQEAFVAWYCSSAVNMNGTEAARRAGYKGTDNTLASVAVENLRKPAIREKVDATIAEAAEGASITVEKVLKNLEITRAKAFECGKYSVAVRCLELQGKYLKMFTDRIEHVEALEDVSMDSLLQLVEEISEVGGIDLSRVLPKKAWS